MNIKIKIKPMEVVKPHKVSPHHLFNSSVTYIIASRGRGYFLKDKDAWVGLVYEKRRRKVTRTRKGTVTKTKVISKAHWITRYYIIPVSLLQAAGLKFQQKTRHFTLTKV